MIILEWFLETGNKMFHNRIFEIKRNFPKSKIFWGLRKRLIKIFQKSEFFTTKNRLIDFWSKFPKIISLQFYRHRNWDEKLNDHIFEALDGAKTDPELFSEISIKNIKFNFDEKNFRESFLTSRFLRLWKIRIAWLQKFCWISKKKFTIFSRES